MNEEEQFYFDTDICRLGGMLLTLKVKPVLYFKYKWNKNIW